MIVTEVNEREIQEYLDKTGYSKDVIEEALNQIERYFEPESVWIEHVWDPEDPTYEHLVIERGTRREVEEDFEVEERFDDDFWLDFIYNLGINLVLSTRYL